MATTPETIETPMADEPRGPRTRQILLLAGGLVLLLVVLWFVFLRGGDEPAVLPPVPAPAPTASPEPDETASEGDQGRVETFEVFAPRDPFRPLVGAEGAAAPGPAASPGAGGEGSIVTPTGDGGGESESIGGHRVRVVDVFPNGRRAQIQVDGTVYTVDEGDRFADNFELLSASGQCATMLFGDDEFTLCEGEEILK